MDFPVELRAAAEAKAADYELSKMKKIASSITEKYRNNSGQSQKIITTMEEAVVYSIIRMPATFGAVYSSLNYALTTSEFMPQTLLDVGAGTGASSWAVDSLLNLTQLTCIEREPVMRQLGKEYMLSGGQVLKNAKWINSDIVRDSISESADLVLASYVLNELNDNDKLIAADKLWKATGQMLLIVEPGTPAGYKSLNMIREHILSQGGHISAPCTHEEKCRIKDDDWCHFSCRISRSKLHKQIKEADVPYEDEKYMYMAFTKKTTGKAAARILRHPYIEKGQVSLELCTKDCNKSVKIKKSDGDIFKTARKSDCGDSIEIS